MSTGCLAEPDPRDSGILQPNAAQRPVYVYLYTPTKSAARCTPPPASIAATLTVAERERAAAMQSGARRASYLAGRALLRHSLSRHADVAPARWRFAAAPTGELRVVAPAAGRHFRVSISHTHGAVACAIGQHARLGLDLEPRRRSVYCLHRLNARFSPAERQALLALPAPQQRQLFLRLWTLKEAFSKALGLGLALPLDAARFDLRGHIAADLTAAGERTDAWRFAQFAWAARHWVAIAQAARALPAAKDAPWLYVAHMPAFPGAPAGAARFVTLTT